MQTGVQQEFAYIPDDYSATYVVNVENNSTRTLPPPSVKDTKSSYIAGITSLVQLDSTGLVYFVPYVPGNDSSANANAAWSNIKALAAVSPANSNSNSNSNSGTSSSRTSSTSTSTPTHTNSDGALSNYPITTGLVGLSVLFTILGAI